MNDLPNGKIVPGDYNYISLVQRHISERVSEILNEPIENEPGLLDSESDEDGIDDVANLDDLPPPARSICEQNGHVSLWNDSKVEEFVRDSSDDNESVLSDEEDMDVEESDDKADALKTKGDEKVQKGLWKEAIDFYSKALQCRQLASLYGNRSLCYMKVEEWEKAERDCCNAIELDPFYKRIFRRRAAIRLRRKDYFGSAADLQSLIILSYNAQLDPTVVEEYKALLPLASLVKFEDVASVRVRDMEKVVLGRLCHIEESAAKSFRERAMWSQVVESLSMALIVSPGTARLLYERAVANFKLGKTNLAETDCSEAIALDPSNHRYYLLRAEIRRKLGKTQDSRSDEEKAKNLSPSGDVSRLEEPASAPAQPAASLVRAQPPPDEPSNFVRIPVRDVYTSNREELYDLSKLPDQVEKETFVTENATKKTNLIHFTALFFYLVVALVGLYEMTFYLRY